MGKFLISILVGALALPLAPVAAQGLSGPVRVIDGDTIEVADTRIRIHGIDAPEADQTCKTEQGINWKCGAWVSEQVMAMFAGKLATCEAVTVDRYNRVVARCRVQGQDMGYEIVSSGLAFAYRKYAQDYVLAEKAAAVRDVGLHASRVQNPSQFRQTRAIGRVPPDRECMIKGNISTKGVKIFHMPGQRDYERTGIRPEKGERWFCSPVQARDAGWRRAKR
ncbi:MAG: thermonuclease family protein [Paracoccaceae bacterium]|nr:thermonuclease family protein [Paracoccaceae bacterium]